MKQLLRVLTLLTFIITLHPVHSFSQETDRDFDQADEEEDLNRELWGYMKKTPYEEMLAYVRSAQAASRATQTAEVELPSGWKITPAGTQVDVGRLPYEIVPFAGRLVVLNTGYYVREPQEVSIVNPVSGQVEKTLKLNSLFPSAVVGSDGDLYVSGGFDQKVFRINREFNVVREYALAGFAGAVTPLGNDQLAIAYLAEKNGEGNYVAGKLLVLNTKTGSIEKQKDIGYFPYALRTIGKQLYVTLLGENKLLVFDDGLNLVKTVPTGRTPQEMCFAGNNLYVANTGSDSVSIIDLRRNTVTRTFDLSEQGMRFGRTPTSCTVEGDRLYVALTGVNAVAVLNKNTGRQLGLIPTGWYPTKVITDNGRLVVLNAKGIRPRRANPDAAYVLTVLKGTVSLIPSTDIAGNLQNWTRQVSMGAPMFDARRGFKLPIRHVFYIVKENRTFDQVLGDLGRGNGDPKLTMFGDDITPVHHQLAREYVTLDNFYANGEISVLGHSFTTSGYASPFLEWMGNLVYSARWKGYPFGTVPAVTSPTYLWDRLDEKKIDYKIYGENYFLFTRAYRILVEKFGADSVIARKFYDKSMKTSAEVDRGNKLYQFANAYYGKANTREAAYQLLGDNVFRRQLSDFLTGDASLDEALMRDTTLRRQFADYLYHYPFNYRSWDLRTSDLDRATAWKMDFDAQLKSGRVAPLSYIWLPNDHTDGTFDRILPPHQFIAQNDAALARIVETISHSSIWQQSLILIVEDDAQNGPDHVDATRTIAFAVGPYIKRAALVNDRYDQLSLLRTIEMLLGLNPLNLGDRLAVPMFGIFNDKPNYDPFVPAKISDKTAESDKEKYRNFK